MLDGIRIRNFKSIDDLSIDLGRFNVFIGENGCGKSNILESILFAAAGFGRNIENESLALRGSRVSDPKFIRSGFEEGNTNKDVSIDLRFGSDKLSFTFSNDNSPFAKWQAHFQYNDDVKMEASIDDPTQNELLNYLAEIREQAKNRINQLDELSSQIPDKLDEKYTRLKKDSEEFWLKVDRDYAEALKRHNEYLGITESFYSSKGKFFQQLNHKSNIADFIIYSPENFFLRNFSLDENYIDPLGYRGEGILKLIQVIKKEKPEHYSSIVENLSLIDWFDTFDIKENSSFGDTEFSITDKYLEDGLKSFDIRNANEGFLYLLFYITLFTSDYTPSLFAIDNIDTALNPKLCSKLITILSQLAVKHDKQVIITTHNPSVLDGLNLNDENERLFVIARNANGHTRAKRVEKKTPLEGEQSIKLSEQFMRGYIGGLPKNF